MRRGAPAVTAALLLLASAPALAAHSPAVVGYLPEWRYGAACFPHLCKHLTHLVFFSIEPLPDGSLTGLERLPGGEALAAAHASRDAFGTKLLLCIGGNGRSSGFSAAARGEQSRARLVAELLSLVTRLDLDGVDWNWEYPGFRFGAGYSHDADVTADWDALAALVRDVKEAASPGRLVSTLAYYPDGRQEAYLAERHLCGPTGVDLCHAMAYDAPGKHHSPLSLAEAAVANARASGFISSMTLGLPLYGRHTTTGEWSTWEDLAGRVANRSIAAQVVDAFLPDGDDRGAGVSFNGPASMRAKVDLALAAGAAGVMLWESGQDCRPEVVTRAGRSHEVTCPAGVPLTQASLHAAVSAEVEAFRSRRGGAGGDELRR